MLLVVVLRNWLVAEYFRKCEQREHSEGSFVTYVMREKERANSELKHLSVLLHRECDEKMLVFTWWCFAVARSSRALPTLKPLRGGMIRAHELVPRSLACVQWLTRIHRTSEYFFPVVLTFQKSKNAESEFKSFNYVYHLDTFLVGL